MEGTFYLINKNGLNSLQNQNHGVCYGRIINITDDTITVTNETGIENLTVNSIKQSTLSIGDIVKVKFSKKDDIINADAIDILTKPIKNPLDNQDNPVSKYLKNNRQYRELQLKKNTFLYQIRSFFTNKEFIEIDTPTLCHSPGMEYHIDAFETEYIDYNYKKHKKFLPTSPEFALKEMLVAGLEKIFEIKKVFRNNGEYTKIHRPEFLMLEWYRAYETYHTLISDTEDLIAHLNKVSGKTLKHKTETVTLKSLFKKYDIDLDNYMIDPQLFNNQAKNLLALSQKTSINNEDLFFRIMMEIIEPSLGFENPIFVTDYPIAMCPLSNVTGHSELYGERFELYINGIEIANGYGELNDATEQRKRFEEIYAYRKQNGLTIYPVPEHFLSRLEYGMPPAAGVALGIERLFMIYNDLEDINSLFLLD